MLEYDIAMIIATWQILNNYLRCAMICINEVPPYWRHDHYYTSKSLSALSRATPHKDCAAETQSDFLSDCTEILQAYCRMTRNFCVI